MDEQAVALAKAIKRTETGDGDTYSAKGKSGEFGAYQFMPDTYKAYAKKYIGDENAEPSIENQNKIAYSFVKEKKDSGYNPSQIASMWNAGEGRPDAYKQNFRGINSKGVEYDTPGYALKVSRNYEQLKGAPVSQPQAPDPALQREPSLKPDETLRNELFRRRNEISDIQASKKAGDITGLESILQQGGQVAALAGSLGTRAISAVTPDVIEKPIAKGLQFAGGLIAKTPIAQEVSNRYGKFKEKNPRAAKNVEAVANIAGVIPQAGAVAETYRLGKNIFKGVAKPVARGLGIKTAQELDPIVNMVTPELSGKETIGAIKRGETQKTGLLGKITIKQDEPTALADAVRGVVDPDKTMTENVTNVFNALGNEAQTLKTRVAGANHPYTFKELNSRINKLEKPVMITSDSVLNNAYNKVRSAAINIAKKEGGTIADLLEARKKFDNFVDQQFPNLYTSEKLTPMKKAITDIRREMNNFASDNLPDGFGFKESLAKQSAFYDAIDNMAPKALKEIGTNRIGRATEKIPNIIKDTVKASAVGGVLKGIGILK